MLNKLKISFAVLVIGISLIGMNFKVSADNSSSVQNNSISSLEVENYLTGKFNPTKHPAFTRVPLKYANRKGHYLRKETLDAFKKMYEAARRDKVTLIIRSSTRNFDYQKRIWNNKWYEKRKKYPNHKSRVENILNYSSMPGTSRHHWGTEVDLNSFNNKWFTTGQGLKLFNWLNTNAHKYGFHRPYTAKSAERPTGYNEEKWHWSYTPLSKQMLADAYGLLNDSKITGFSGSKYATSLEIVKNYVFGVDPSCR